MEIQVAAIEPGEPGLVCLRLRGTVSPLSGADPLEQMLGEHWRGNVLVDLQQATFIDSEGLAWLVRWQRRLQQAGGTLGLYAVPGRVADVLQMCHLDRILPVWPDEAAARAGVTGGRAEPDDPTSSIPVKRHG
jgi:anti-anti-sigma factor